MKPIDVKWDTYIDSSKQINDKNSKFEISDIARILKYKNIFAQGYIPNWSEAVFIIKKVKNTAPWTYIINILNWEEIVWRFNENEMHKYKSNQKEFRIEKVINRNGDKLCVKWKELYGNIC